MKFGLEIKIVIIEVAKPKQLLVKLVKHGINKFHMSITIKILTLGLTETITTAEILMENKIKFGVLLQILILLGNYVILLVG